MIGLEKDDVVAGFNIVESTVGTQSISEFFRDVSRASTKTKPSFELQKNIARNRVLL
jgi:hypothetical protein